MRVLFVAAVCLPSLAFAAPVDDLQHKLSQWRGFSAQFAQQTYSFDGELVQSGEGQIRLNKPDLFKWHTQTPDEMLIQSDGSTIWIYNPMLEQVTLYSASQFEDSTPLSLLATNDSAVWQAYEVSERDGRYRLVPKSEDSGIDYFELAFQQSRLAGFTILDKQGQRSEFSLSGFKPEAVASQDLFRFQVPQGIDIDDQREQ